MDPRNSHRENPEAGAVHRADVQAPGVSPPGPIAIPVDMSSVTVLQKNWNGPSLTIDWDRYTGISSADAGKKFKDIDPAIKVPTLLHISELTDGSGDLAGVPTLTAGKSTLEMSWGKRGKEARIDFARYFMLRPFPIPMGTRARIPLEFTELTGIGKCVVIKLSATTFQQITKREPKQTTEQTEKK